MNQNVIENHERLPLSFHQTFIPERHYLVKILDFSVNEKSGDISKISNTTGIPTGKTSGKVEPIIRYSEGMGVIKTNKGKGKEWHLDITPLGNQIRQDDPFISETLSQWLLHIRLCRPNGGAEVWHRIFTEGRLALGKTFSKDALKDYLYKIYGNRSSLPGPIIRMYNDPSSFSKCAALEEQEGNITYRHAPTQQFYFPGYTALLMLAWDELFKNQQQIGLDEFESQSGFFKILGWSNDDTHYFLDWLVDQGNLVLDSRVGGTVLLRKKDTNSIIKNIFDSLI